MARVQSEEQSLRLQTTSLTHEIKQKGNRLEELTRDKQELEGQLASVNAELATSKTELEKVRAELVNRDQLAAASPVPGAPGAVPALSVCSVMNMMPVTVHFILLTTASMEGEQAEFWENRRVLQRFYECTLYLYLGLPF